MACTRDVSRASLGHPFPEVPNVSSYELRRDDASRFYEYRGMPRQSVPKTLFGKRLREAREKLGLPQDKLGVMIGIDEGSSSARISRYETGEHEPPYLTAKELASVLKVPVAYLYCDDDALAKLIIGYSTLTAQHKREIAKRISDLQVDG